LKDANLLQAATPRRGRLKDVPCYVTKKREGEIFCVPQLPRYHASGGKDGGRWYPLSACSN